MWIHSSILLNHQVVFQALTRSKSPQSLDTQTKDLRTLEFVGGNSSPNIKFMISSRSLEH